MHVDRALMLRCDMGRGWRVLLLAGALLAVPATTLAQQDDLPGRVGRISVVGGELFLAPEERASDWAPAGINYPVTTGDNLWAGLDGRAEVDFGGGQFRLAGETNVHVSRLDDSTFGLFVAQGRLHVRIRVLDAGDVARIDTPNTQITLTRPGSYRIDVGADGQRTLLVVREGEALAQVAAGLQQVLPGQTATITGTDVVYADVRNGVALDGFDTWVADRDRRYERNRSTAYVSRQMVGYAELDEHGSWQTLPDYGPVWFPTAVAADWAPYRNGYWTNVGAYGPTWVDYAPWGYAPFHYGRWAHVGGRWGWCPGEYVARPYWAPALVGWVGGSRWTISVAGGGPVYGWVPLGWREPYRPSWNNCGSRCWNNYNKPYAVNVAERPSAPPTRYVNSDRPGGTTAVHGAAFTGRKPVSANLVALTGSTASTAPVLANAPVIARPIPADINAVKPGQRGTPPPASTVYANQRPAASVALPGLPGASTAPPPLSMPGTASVAPAPNAVPPGARRDNANAPARPLPGTTTPSDRGSSAYARPAPAGSVPVPQSSVVVPAPATPGNATPSDRGSPAYARPAPAGSVPVPQSSAPVPAPVMAAPSPSNPAPAPMPAQGYSKPQQRDRSGDYARQDGRPPRETQPGSAAPSQNNLRPPTSVAPSMPATQPSTARQAAAPSMAAPQPTTARPAPAPTGAVAPPTAAPAPQPARNAGQQGQGGNKKPPAEERAGAPGAAKEK